jgi:hypothetical protein
MFLTDLGTFTAKGLGARINQAVAWQYGRLECVEVYTARFIKIGLWRGVQNKVLQLRDLIYIVLTLYQIQH